MTEWTEKKIATAGVTLIGVIVAISLGIRWALTGDSSSEMLTLLGTLGGFLLAGRLNGAATRVVNGAIKRANGGKK